MGAAPLSLRTTSTTIDYLLTLREQKVAALGLKRLEGWGEKVKGEDDKLLM